MYAGPAVKWFTMKPNDEPPIWLTIAKLVIGAAVLIGGVGFALWYFKDEQSKSTPSTTKPADSWGIANDSPIHFKR
jgi:hypothetical protein